MDRIFYRLKQWWYEHQLGVLRYRQEQLNHIYEREHREITRSESAYFEKLTRLQRDEVARRAMLGRRA